MLNKSKGPAVWSSRCQSDRKLYSEEAYQIISVTSNLEIVEESVIKILTENKKVIGVKTDSRKAILCDALILSAGTFLNGLMHTGLKKTIGGRFGEQAATGVTESLANLGFEHGKLKTGTPPRLKKDSINWSILEEQPGDKNPQPFSHQTALTQFPFLPQISCHITYTDPVVHKILEKGFSESPMFTGLIKGVGPRYCPSIEDKIVRFADKDRHQLFLEPEGLDSDQINGTSGYEEAAAQGLIAGINAALKIQGKPEFVLKRSEAYIGVLIDDLVTKSTDEPYRMFTSRAEHRLLLRQDNADRRLMKYGYQFGLIPRHLLEEVDNREKIIINGINYCQSKKYHARDVNEFLVKSGSNEIDSTETISKLCKRPEFNLKQLLEFNGSSQDPEAVALLQDEKALEQTEIEIKYEGYIQRQYETVSKLEKYEDTKIPLNFDFKKIKQLSTEGREKLNKVKPRSIAQASRISGVTPSDISILLVYLKN